MGRRAKVSCREAAQPTRSEVPDSLRPPASSAAHTPTSVQLGQNSPASGRCISTLLPDGAPCMEPLPDVCLPYCAGCRKRGDPSLKVVDSGRIGLILVAARDLPRRYFVCWFGKLYKKSEFPEHALEWALETDKGTINAKRHTGSLLKNCACVGPDELVSITFSPDSDRFLSKENPVTGVVFATTAPAYFF